MNRKVRSADGTMVGAGDTVWVIVGESVYKVLIREIVDLIDWPCEVLIVGDDSRAFRHNVCYADRVRLQENVSQWASEFQVRKDRALSALGEMKDPKSDAEPRRG